MIVPKELVDILERYDRILIAAHARPDGDAVGSSVGLAWLLRHLDKNVILYNASGFSDTYGWLKLPVPLLTKVEDLPAPPDLIITLDSGDAARLGEDIQPLLAETPSVNIDHHLGNPKYGSLLNWVEPHSAATGEMVAHLAGEMGVPLAGAIAEALYLAMVTDTGAFAYGSTTGSTMRLCAEMMDNGLNVSAIRAHIGNNWTEARMKLWGELLQTAQILEDGKAAVGIVTNELLAKYGADREDTEGFVEQLRKVRGVRVALMLVELPAGGKMRSKISLRSSGNDDVRAVAVQFGGGGHKNAAGASLPLAPDKAFIQIMPYVLHVWAKDEYAKTPCPSAGSGPVQ